MHREEEVVERLVKIEAKVDFIMSMESRIKVIEGRLWGLAILAVTSLGGAVLTMAISMWKR